MKSINTIVYLLLFSVILFAAGFYFFAAFYEFALPFIDGVYYQMEAGKTGNTIIVFSLVLAIIPICTFITWDVAGITTLYQKLSVIFIIILFMVIAVIVRTQSLKFYLTTLTKNRVTNTLTTQVNFLFEELNFEYYLLGGLIVGCLVSYGLFGTRKHYR